MKPFTHTTTYQVDKLSEAEREQLSVELYGLHCQIFSGVSFSAFRQYVVCSPAWKTWLFVQKNDAGDNVGYLALHAFKKKVAQRSHIIFRMELGTLEEYRGKDLALFHALRKMIVVWTQHFTWPTYFFASLIYPSSYALAAKYSPRLWPNRNKPLPAKKQQLMEALAADFGLLPLNDNPQPLLRQLSWVTKERAAKRIVWERKRNPDAAYFVQLNPDYGKGHGLLTLVPAAFPQLFFGLTRFALYRGSRAIRRSFTQLIWPSASATATA